MYKGKPMPPELKGAMNDLKERISATCEREDSLEYCAIIGAMVCWLDLCEHMLEHLHCKSDEEIDNMLGMVSLHSSVICTAVSELMGTELEQMKGFMQEYLTIAKRGRDSETQVESEDTGSNDRPVIH